MQLRMLLLALLPAFAAALALKPVASAVASITSAASTAAPKSFACRFCGVTSIPSRNLLFEHLRASRSCADAAASENVGATKAIFSGTPKYSSMLVGYVGGEMDGDVVEDLIGKLVEPTRPMTRASASRARGRSTALAQEPGCAAALDVVSVASTLPIQADWLNERLPEGVVILQVAKQKVHAEASVSQRAYHYLLPLRWLAGVSAEAADALLPQEDVFTDADGVAEAEDADVYAGDSDRGRRKRRYGVRVRAHEARGAEASALYAALREFKVALKSASELRWSDDPAWHNFADPQLRGAASPFAAAARIRLDRARAAEFVRVGGEVHVVVELRARGFVSQQVRRVVAAAVLMQRGALPNDYFWLATRKDVVLETPMAPLERLYFAGARFLFAEISRRTFFKDDASTRIWIAGLRESLIQRAKLAGDTDEWLFDAEKDWIQRKGALDALRTRQAEFLQFEVPEVTSIEAAPEPYDGVLTALRAASSSGKWPATSAARAKLIRGCVVGHVFRPASLTISSDGSMLGNSLFPDLAQQIFALERQLEPGRASTRCAVNMQAAFSPHVDSGQGAGQSLSMIVGLGSYTGGELCVETVEHNVRYQPLVFDGWQERHWTLPFQGERFSLVWFSPKDSASLEDAAADGAAAGADIGVRDAEALDRTAPPDVEKRPASEIAEDIAALYGLDYRRGTTDADALVEVLWKKSYSKAPLTLQGFEWSFKDQVVLDCGAHIGAFTRLAVECGCASVLAFEPEPSNARLFRKNNILRPSTVSLVEAAVVADAPVATRTLVEGLRRKSDGAQNTWRHALSEYAHYIQDEETPSNDQTVNVLAFDGVLSDEFTFVKLDVEGAERDILLQNPPQDWRNVRRLIFEWSFTKDRQMAPFRAALSRLEAAGFQCAYQGAAETAAANAWPKSWTDVLVFAARDAI